MNVFEVTRQLVCMPIPFGEGVQPQQLFSKTRKREVVLARQMLMYFTKEYTKESFAHIGSNFKSEQNPKGLDHATVMHGCKTIKNLIDTDKIIANKINVYTIKIESHIGFEKNVTIDKIIEIKEYVKRQIDENQLITNELIVIYNNLIEKVTTIPELKNNSK
jgi:hypothetical protein